MKGIQKTLAISERIKYSTMALIVIFLEGDINLRVSKDLLINNI